MLKNRKINFFKNDSDDNEKNLFMDKPTDYKPDIEFQKWMKKKKKEIEIEENKEVEFLNPINLKINVFHRIKRSIKRLIYFQKYNKNKLEKTKSQLINYYCSLNLKKFIYLIKNGNKKNEHFLYNNHIILIIDIRKQKPIITVINNNKTFLCLTAGIVFKKMKMKEKKNKKSEKMVVTMLKLVFNEITQKINNNNLLVNIKGLTFNVDVLYSTIESYSSSFNFFFLNSFHKRRNKLKFKKIKAIKRRLRKKFLNETNYD